MVKKVIFLFFIFYLFSCKKECAWPPPDINIPLRDSNVNWLKGLPIDTTLTASSNKGRTLSYRLVPSFWFIYFGSGDCEVYKGQENFVKYSSSIYNYNFNILVYRHWDKDKFILCGPYMGSYYDEDSKAEIILSDKNYKMSAVALRSWKISGNLDSTFSKIDTLVVNNKTYFDVYKIDFFEKKYSLDDKVKVFYIDLKKGVLRFDTFDGEIWTLNFK